MSVEHKVDVEIVRAPRGVAPHARNGHARMGAFAVVELQKLRHDHTELFTRMVQPALWLLIFGQTFSRLRVIDTGHVPYLAFLAPGIIAQSALFISIFYGIQIIWDRDAGILAKLMVTPAPASALITGKAFAAGVRSVVQVIGVLALAYLLRVHLTVNPLRILGAMARCGPRLSVLCVSVDDAGRAGSQQGSDDGHRAGHHDAVVLRVERAVPGRRDAAVAALAVGGQPAQLRGQRAARTADRYARATASLDIAVLVVAAVAGIAMASALLRRLVR